MAQIFNDLYQFTDVIEPIKLSMHSYLLSTEEAVLIQTGAVPQAMATIPQIKKLLGHRPLKYILISHFESDECGGLSLVLSEFPTAVPVCSEVTARQLWGFGLAQNVLIEQPNNFLGGNDFEFVTIGYPSEMHLWEGLLFIEAKRGIFFSSDLMFQMGETHGQVIESTWEDAILRSGASDLASLDMQKRMMDNLAKLQPQFVASGHGPCIKIIN